MRSPTPRCAPRHDDTIVNLVLTLAPLAAAVVAIARAPYFGWLS